MFSGFFWNLFGCASPHSGAGLQRALFSMSFHLSVLGGSILNLACSWEPHTTFPGNLTPLIVTTVTMDDSQSTFSNLSLPGPAVALTPCLDDT
jgi:hypothetical protein